MNFFAAFSDELGKEAGIGGWLKKQFSWRHLKSNSPVLKFLREEYDGPHIKWKDEAERQAYFDKWKRSGERQARFDKWNKKKLDQEPIKG